MKTKKIVLMLLITVMTILLSGCAKISCFITFKDNESISVSANVLYTDSKFKYNNETIENLKKDFKAQGYVVKDIEENGLKGFSLQINEIDLVNFESVAIKEYGINVKLNGISNYNFTRGFFSNRYDVNAKVDLSELSNIASVTDGAGNVIMGEELNKLISNTHFTFNVVSKLGNVSKANSTAKYLDDERRVEWNVLPGEATDVSVRVYTTSTLNIIGSVIVVSVIVLFAVLVFLLLLKMYIKRKKECSEE